MNVILDYLPEILTVVISAITGIWAIVRLMNNMRDHLIEEKFKNMRDDINNLERLVHRLEDQVDNDTDIKKIYETLNNLNVMITEIKLTFMKKEDVGKIHNRIDDISTLLHKTREDLARESGLEEAEDINLKEKFAILENAISLCNDFNSEQYLKNGGVERRSGHRR